MNKFKIKKENKPDIKQWCTDNFGKEGVRWWIDEDLLGLNTYSSRPDTLSVDLTEEEEIQLTHFILKYGE